jgi:hypothetical protein
MSIQSPVSSLQSAQTVFLLGTDDWGLTTLTPKVAAR